jgi:hypothetical protein
MCNRKFAIVLVLLLSLFTIKVNSQEITLSNNAEVSILTCGTGSEIYSLFGHTAIRIKDTTNFVDQVYNYGTFDFSTPNFYLKFVKGDLQYLETSCTFEEFFQEYLYEKRSIDEQVLNLSLEKKQALFDYLNASLQSDERFYTYKFIDKNCTTMVINTINKIIGKPVIGINSSDAQTCRTILYPYFNNHFYTQLGTSIIFGNKVDLKSEQLFLPSELYNNIKDLKVDNQPICKESNKILEVEKTEIPFSWWNNFYVFCLFFLIVILLNKPSIYKAYFVLLGLLGLFFIFAGFYSLHRELVNNYNVLLFNPMLFALIYFEIKNNKKWLLYSSVFCIISLLIYIAILKNKPYLGIVAPFIITSGVRLIQLFLKNRR